MTKNPKPTNDPAIPSSIEAEKFVLGSILLDYRHALSQTAGITADDFHIVTHQRIWQAMKSLTDDGADIDYLTVVTRLDSMGHLEAIGGVTYISSLTDGLPKLENIRSYVAIVQEKARLRDIISAAALITSKAIDQQPSSEILPWGVQILCEVSGEAGVEIVRMGDDLRDNLKGILDHQSHGLSTGLLAIDNMTGGLQPSELTIIGARPSVGKSSFAFGLAKQCCRDSHTCLIYSLEMTRASVAQRLLCMLARVDLQRLRLGYLNEDERARIEIAVDDLIDWPLYINDRAALTIDELNLSLRSISRLKPKIVIVDYLQQLIAPDRYKSRTEAVSAIARSLKVMAKEHKIAVVALAQLSRESERRAGSGKRPQLSDLRDSGEIEQEADMVILLHRPEMHARDREDLKGIAEAIIAKQRNGPTGTVKLAFLHKYATFENLATGFEDGQS